MKTNFDHERLRAYHLNQGKVLLSEFVGLFVGLIKSKLPDPFREEELEYRTGEYE